MKATSKFFKEHSGMIVVEATILLPIIIMIFFGLIMLCMYLPTRAVLQHATQTAATIIATEKSDTWITYDEANATYNIIGSKSELPNVYSSVIQGFSSDDTSMAEDIVQNIENNAIIPQTGTLTVDAGVVNYYIYKEVVVTAKKTYSTGVDFSLIGFPTSIEVEVTSTAVVNNGDEFIRNIDIAVDVVKAIDEKYSIADKFSGVTKLLDTFAGFLG